MTEHALCSKRTVKLLSSVPVSVYLVAESAVQQDSKQVQVDLQDLGYETSGRSENEAEREDTSSPGMLLRKLQGSADHCD